MTNSIKLNKDVKKYLKKLYTKGNFSDVKIKFIYFFNYI